MVTVCGDDARVQKVVVIALLAACSSAPEVMEDDGDDDDGTKEPTDDDFAQLAELNDGKADGVAEWVAVGNGVAYQRVGTGHAVLIAYGGYTAQIKYSSAWATELVKAKLGASGVGHIYAVKGPADAGYAAKEIGNSKIRAHLATYDDNAATIYVVGHSSGSFVAHEIFQQLHAKGMTNVLARMEYADLDGGGSGLTSAIVEELGGTKFVYARDPVAGLSRNASAAMSLASSYAPHATLFEVKISGTGCNAGAGWCMHDVVITHAPHNPATYDLMRDYTDFVGRPVTIEYF